VRGDGGNNTVDWGVVEVGSGVKVSAWDGSLGEHGRLRDLKNRSLHQLLQVGRGGSSVWVGVGGMQAEIIPSKKINTKNKRWCISEL
jgi:hypothetical protein